MFEKKNMDRIVGVFMLMSIANMAIQWYYQHKRHKREGPRASGPQRA